MMNLLLSSIFVAGVMAALIFIIGAYIRPFATSATSWFRGSSFDNSQALRVPVGAALTFTVVLYGALQFREGVQ